MLDSCNGSGVPTKPFVFIAHSDRDKPLLVGIIGCLLDDGVDVVIDNVSDLQQFHRHIAAGRLRPMFGHWETELITLLEAPASYVLGFISVGAAKLDHPDDHRVLRLELEECG